MGANERLWCCLPFRHYQNMRRKLICCVICAQKLTESSIVRTAENWFARIVEQTIIANPVVKSVYAIRNLT